MQTSSGIDPERELIVGEVREIFMEMIVFILNLV